MPEYLVVPRGEIMGPYKWFATEPEAREKATRASERSKTKRCTVTRVNLDGVEPIARYYKGKEVTEWPTSSAA